MLHLVTSLEVHIYVFIPKVGTDAGFIKLCYLVPASAKALFYYSPLGLRPSMGNIKTAVVCPSVRTKISEMAHGIHVIFKTQLKVHPWVMPVFSDLKKNELWRFYGRFREKLGSCMFEVKSQEMVHSILVIFETQFKVHPGVMPLISDFKKIELWWFYGRFHEKLSAFSVLGSCMFEVKSLWCFKESMWNHTYRTALDQGS